MQLKCTGCEAILAHYDESDCLYKLDKETFKKSFSNRFDHFLEFPINLHCRLHPEVLLTYTNKNSTELSKIKCKRCKNKTIGVLRKANSSGMEINFENVQKNIAFGNAKINCPLCGKLFDLEVLRNEGKSIDIILRKGFNKLVSNNE